MANGLPRARYWVEFILTRCPFPAPRTLRAQFEASDFVEFCDCGCNSFKLRTRAGARPPPIAAPGGYGSVFEADFRTADEDKTIEIVLFADQAGNLAYVEIDCCANSQAVPDTVELMDAPYHVNASPSLIV